ncbi:MAG: Acyl-CoA synthetase (AMP-forming)/AMP-acid ligase, partial [Frankiales bacterium]|nr:Acyl-CoA synthetase (AMP-forming)/AMP-acid ligase [Frankiales bacterium]
MLGYMQEGALTIDAMFHHVERHYGEKNVTTNSPTGRQRMSYRQWAERVRRLGGALADLGLSPDARVGSFGWNSGRHLELYFGVPATGRVLHTVNIRLYPEQVTYIVNHAQDEAIFIDRSLLPVFWPLITTMPSVRQVIVMDDGVANELPEDPRVLDYEQLLAQAKPAEFHVADERLAAGMCYTSGTTGNPKCVVYSHRSTILH